MDVLNPPSQRQSLLKMGVLAGAAVLTDVLNMTSPAHTI